MSVVEYHHGYTETAVVKNGKRLSIMQDLASHALPEDIKQNADSIYRRMGCPTRRKNVRQQMLFWCVYNSYLEFKRHVDKERMGRVEFGLSDKNIKRTSSIFSATQTGYDPPDVIVHPHDYVPAMCEAVGLDDSTVPLVHSYFDYLLKVYPDLSERKPKTAAAGMFQHYLETHGVQLVDPRAVSAVAGIDEVTIKGIVEKIKEAEYS